MQKRKAEPQIWGEDQERAEEKNAKGGSEDAEDRCFSGRRQDF